MSGAALDPLATMIPGIGPAAAPSASPPPETGSPAPDAAASAPAADEAVMGADGIKDVVAAKSETAGTLVETLDNFAISAGAMRISAWDVLVVLMVIVFVIAVAYFGSRFSQKALGRLTLIDQAQRVLFEKLTAIVVWAIAILIGIDILGIDLTALTFFSGAFGLAIGFGLQKTFGNLIAGIILLMDRSIKPGDVIAIADQAGQSTFGQIRKIGIRAVSITTRDQIEYLIPNENLMINQVENWSYSSRTVRMQIPVNVSYLADLDKAEELMLQAAKSAKRVLENPAPTIWLDAFGENSVKYIIHCWIMDPEMGIGNIRSEVLKTIWRLFKEHKIEIPNPQLDVKLRDNEAFRELVQAMRQRRHKEE